MDRKFEDLKTGKIKVVTYYDVTKIFANMNGGYWKELPNLEKAFDYLEIENSIKNIEVVTEIRRDRFN